MRTFLRVLALPVALLGYAVAWVLFAIGLLALIAYVAIFHRGRK
jgi:hypothetical protein